MARGSMESNEGELASGFFSFPKYLNINLKLSCSDPAGWYLASDSVELYDFGRRNLDAWFISLVGIDCSMAKLQDF